MDAWYGRRGARTAVAAFAASGLAFSGSVALLGAGTSNASSHREAPLILNDPQADNTDLYTFVSPNKPDTVTMIANWVPFEEPAGGPNFYPFSDSARYNIKIDNDGDAEPDITYRWVFQTQDDRGIDTFLYNNGPVTSLDDKNLLFKQTYTLKAVTGSGKDQKVKTLLKDAPVSPSDVGEASMPDYAALRDAAVTKTDGGGRSFAGQADDPFFADLRIFDLLYGGDFSETGDDTLAGYNVNTIALQVPISDLVAGDPVVGVWTSTDRRSTQVQHTNGTQRDKGAYVQVSRLGNPLVNEVVVPAGLKDAFNALPPAKDASVKEVVNKVEDPEVPKLIEQIYGIPAPKTPRDDLFAIFLTGISGLNKPKGKVTPAEMLRLNTSIAPTKNPKRLGVLVGDKAGFPNGRRLADDVVDIELQALEGAVRKGKLIKALGDGDRVNHNDVPFEGTFPYVALPHPGSSDGPGGAVDAGGGGTASNSRPASATSGGASSGGNGSPWLPATAAVLGLGLATLGVAVLRRNRTRPAE
ncbi:MAG: DUF4331 domain-containing protein [Streptomycetales bacterium]